MPKVTWLGDIDHPDNRGVDPCCTWGDYVFPLDTPVEVSDPHIIGKARNNPYFRVEPEAEPASGRVDYDTFLDAPLTPPKRSHKKKVEQP